MVLGIHRHPMIASAAFNRIASHNRICRGVDLGNLVGAAQVNVDFSSDRVVFLQASTGLPLPSCSW